MVVKVEQEVPKVETVVLVVEVLRDSLEVVAVDIREGEVVIFKVVLHTLAVVEVPIIPAPIKTIKQV